MDIILCHTTADFDTLGAAVGLSCLLPGSRIVLAGGAHPTVRNFLALHWDAYPLMERRSVSPRHITGIHVVDAQRRSRLGKTAEWLDLPQVQHIHVYDHHGCDRPNPDFSAADRPGSDRPADHPGSDRPCDSDIPAHHWHIAPVGAATTLIVEALQHHHPQGTIVLNPMQATVMALGIHADTGSLTFDHSTPRDGAALAWLMAQGATIALIGEYISPGFPPALQELLPLALQSLQTHTHHGHSLGVVHLNLGEFLPGLSSLASQLMELTDSSALLLAVDYPSKGDDRRGVIIGRSAIEGTDLHQLFQPWGGGGHPKAASLSLHGSHLRDLLGQLTEQLLGQIPPPLMARELMSAPVRTIRPTTAIAEAQRILLRYGHSGLSVVDEWGSLVGIISRRDLDLALHHGLGHAPVKGYMATQPKTITPDTPLPAIEDLMVTYDIGRLPVVEEGALVGIVTRTDVLRQRHQQTFPHRLPHPHPACPWATAPQEFLRSRLVPALWELLQTAAQAAESRGWHLYLVGGAVRDLLLAEGMLPGESSLQNNSLQNNLSQGNLSGNTPLQNNLSQNSISQGNLSQGNLSQGNLLGNSPSQDNLSQDSIPQDSIPQDNLSQGDSLQSNLFQGDLSGNSPSQDNLSQGNLSGNSPSQDNLSQGNLSGNSRLQDNLSQDSIPQGNLSQGNLSEGSLSGNSRLQDNLLQDSIPQGNLSQGNLSGNSRSQDNLSQDNLSQGNLSQGNLSGNSRSQDSIPQGNLSQGNLSGNSRSQDNSLQDNFPVDFLSGDRSLKNTSLQDFPTPNPLPTPANPDYAPPLPPLLLSDIDLVVDGYHASLTQSAGVELARALQPLYPQARLEIHGRFQTAALLWHQDPVLGSLWVDIATARTEFYPYPAANPEVESSSIQQDLYRRDFTINALALRLTTPRPGLLLDFFGGLLDLQERQVRVLHANSFIEDPTRIYRAVRFAVRLGFELEPQTRNYMAYALDSGVYERTQGENPIAPALQSRLRSELQYILSAPYWLRALDLLGDLQALRCIHGSLWLTPELRRRVRLLDRYLSWVQRHPPDPTARPLIPWLLRLEGLLTGLDPHLRSPIAQKLQLPAETLDRLDRLETIRETLATQLPALQRPSQIYHLLCPWDGATLGLVAVQLPRSLRRPIWHHLTHWLPLSPPLGGEDLKALGYKPGRQFKVMLDRVFTAALDGELTGDAGGESDSPQDNLRQRAIDLVRREFPLIPPSHTPTHPQTLSP